MGTSHRTLQYRAMDSRDKYIINRRTRTYYIKVIVYRIPCPYYEDSYTYYFAYNTLKILYLIISIINYQDWHCILVGCSICGKF